MTLLERLELIVKILKYPNATLEMWDEGYDDWFIMKWDKDRESFRIVFKNGHSREVYIEDIISFEYKIRDYAQPEDR